MLGIIRIVTLLPSGKEDEEEEEKEVEDVAVDTVAFRRTETTATPINSTVDAFIVPQVANSNFQVQPRSIQHQSPVSLDRCAAEMSRIGEDSHQKATNKTASPFANYFNFQI